MYHNSPLSTSFQRFSTRRGIFAAIFYDHPPCRIRVGGASGVRPAKTQTSRSVRSPPHSSPPPPPADVSGVGLVRADATICIQTCSDHPSPAAADSAQCSRHHPEASYQQRRAGHCSACTGEGGVEQGRRVVLCFRCYAPSVCREDGTGRGSPFSTMIVPGGDGEGV